MKTNLLRKFKWYIVGFIMIVIMLSVGLSFCTWDDLSINKALSTAKTGNYTEQMYNLGTNEGDDKGTIGVVDVGDIVTFGRYWQDTGANGVEGQKPQRWIVVNIDEKSKVATLLTEKVVVYGNFWGLDKEGEYTYYQNYYQSTLRAWLNSGRDSVAVNENSWTIGKVGTENLRDDTIANGIGSAFNGDINNKIQANRGFLDVAFSDTERSILVPKNISGLQGYDQQNNPSTLRSYTTRNGNTSINDLVWVPSWSEIYSTTMTPWGTTLEESPSTQFEYFKDKVAYTESNIILVSEATDYAYDSYSTIASYYNNGVGRRNGNKKITNVNGVDNGTWWWLRSPISHSSYSNYVLSVHTHGGGYYAGTRLSGGGVRPAVCIKL